MKHSRTGRSRSCTVYIEASRSDTYLAAHVVAARARGWRAAAAGVRVASAVAVIDRFQLVAGGGCGRAGPRGVGARPRSSCAVRRRVVGLLKHGTCKASNGAFLTVQINRDL